MFDLNRDVLFVLLEAEFSRAKQKVLFLKDEQIDLREKDDALIWLDK